MQVDLTVEQLYILGTLVGKLCMAVPKFNTASDKLKRLVLDTNSIIGKHSIECLTEANLNDTDIDIIEEFTNIMSDKIIIKDPSC